MEYPKKYTEIYELMCDSSQRCMQEYPNKDLNADLKIIFSLPCFTFSLPPNDAVSGCYGDSPGKRLGCPDDHPRANLYHRAVGNLIRGRFGIGSIGCHL